MSAIFLTLSVHFAPVPTLEAILALLHLSNSPNGSSRTRALSLSHSLSFSHSFILSLVLLVVFVVEQRLTKRLSALSPSERRHHSPRAFYCRSVHCRYSRTGSVFFFSLLLLQQEATLVQFRVRSENHRRRRRRRFSSQTSVWSPRFGQQRQRQQSSGRLCQTYTIPVTNIGQACFD